MATAIKKPTFVCPINLPESEHPTCYFNLYHECQFEALKEAKELKRLVEEKAGK
jgi:hypothetical protein